MDWLTENWFWTLFLILFIGIHLFGHGGHGQDHQSHLQKEGHEHHKDHVGNTKQ